MEREIGTARKLWFPVRDRGAGLCGRRSLLVADRNGVYSFAHRRYIRNTRYRRYRALTAELDPVVKAYRSLQELRMKNWPEHRGEAWREVFWKHELMELAPVVQAYRSLQKLGMKSWPEHDEEARREIAIWKNKLMDMYWDAAPTERRVSAMAHYLRVRYIRRMFYPFAALDALVYFGRVAQLVLLGRYTPTWGLLSLLGNFLLIWCLVALMEKLATSSWIVLTRSRSEIHDVLEFEFTN